MSAQSAVVQCALPEAALPLLASVSIGNAARGCKWLCKRLATSIRNQPDCSKSGAAFASLLASSAVSAVFASCSSQDRVPAQRQFRDVKVTLTKLKPCLALKPLCAPLALMCTN
jgi:hypothetical protein